MTTTPPDPTPAPTSASLLRSTVIAAAVAGVLLVTCVLPAEYGKDPTGVGRVLGLTQMGEVKLALAEEAASNAAAEAAADSVIAAAESGSPAGEVRPAAADAAAPEAALARVDTTLVTLAPGKGGEVKLIMPDGTRAAYHWAVTGGVVNYDMHGDSTNAPKDWFVSYRKGQRTAADSGDLVAEFNGNHGWFWRNRGTRAVLVTLITAGSYRRIETHP
ncbi:MAG: transmembrane anchor protein [Gemmatimonadota bacterium]